MHPQTANRGTTTPRPRVTPREAPGRWLLGVLAWATALAPLCWYLALPYQRWLGETLSYVLPSLGVPIRVTGLGVSTPFEIGLFAALCLASRRTRLAGRLGALLRGLALIVAAELVLFAASFALEFWMGGSRGGGHEAPGVGRSIRELIVWGLAPGIWFLLLGPQELALDPAMSASAQRHPDE